MMSPPPPIQSVGGGQFGRYQWRLLFVTQIGYMVISPSMLCTTLGTNSSQFNCTIIANETLPIFHSLLVEWNLDACESSYILTLLSTSIMVGAVIGSFISGFLADRCGRKPIVFGTMAGVAVFNGLISAVGSLSIIGTCVLLFGLGAFAGGYLVTNMVLMLEACSSQHWRLLAVTLHGWPFGLMAMALIGYLTGDWQRFHITLTIIASICTVLLYRHSNESARWLYQQHRVDEARRILKHMANINRQKHGDISIIDEMTIVDGAVTTRTNYSYWDLTRHRTIYVPLLALLYCWLVSSVVTYGVYFNIDVLPGNAYVKLFAVGLFKLVTGSIPFAFARHIGRRPIFLASVAIADICCLAVVALYATNTYLDSLLLTALTIVTSAAIDPMWKVNHLYSAELFPTVIRNMARALCNVAARLGSAAAPSLTYGLRQYSLAYPYILFGLLMSVQFLLAALCLPETRNQQLPDQLPDDSEDNKNDCNTPIRAITAIDPVASGCISPLLENDRVSTSA